MPDGTTLDQQVLATLNSQLHQMSIDPAQYSERLSGYPQPNLYDKYYINKYAYPKGLKSYRKP